MVDNKPHLIDISPDKITPNPENPRLIFREEDMKVLLESINAVGIKVPLTVYGYRNKYVILDGERRWRCSRKLNLGTVPVIVQPKPEKLENLLTMFNIHNVRVDWDTIATALKLGEVRDILYERGEHAEILDLANLTGLSRSMVRSNLELLELPKKYIKLLLQEAEKPKKDQKITPDLFIEINKSYRVIQSYLPELLENVTQKKYLDIMVAKYVSGRAKSVTSFRDISKIARAELAGLSTQEIVPILSDLILDETYSVEEAYSDSAKGAYEQRDIASRAEALFIRLNVLNTTRQLSEDAKNKLIDLRDRITNILGE